MKPIHGLLTGAAITFALMSCNSKHSADGDASSDSIVESTDMSTTTTTATSHKVTAGNYLDLNSGKKVYIIPDSGSGYATDSIAKVPIEFYINPETNDTLDRTGMVVNNMLVQEDGKWKLDETKVKIDGDKMKMKDGDSKTKINGDESKVKDGDYKQKMDGDDGKIKDGDTKIKIKDGEVVKKKH